MLQCKSVHATHASELWSLAGNGVEENEILFFCRQCLTEGQFECFLRIQVRE